MRKYITVILLFLFTIEIYALRHTVNGYVVDASSGERLIGATIIDTLSRQGAITNNGGFFSLTLNEGEIALCVSYVGYQHVFSERFTLLSDTLINFTLETGLALNEVTVTAQKSVSSPMSVQMSAVEVPVQQVKGIPALGGEVDVIKAVQLLPGVQSGTEGSAGLYVRGGGPDQNMVMLNGVPLYSVNHAMGFFSVFNADAIKTLTLYKGNFPARYGSRLSSVLDVRQNDGNAQNYHGNVTVGLIAAKVNVEGPIVKGKTTFNVSARRTYFDLFTTPIMHILTAKEMETGSAGAGYYFFDVNAQVTHRFSDNDRLSGSFYMGDDVVYANYKERDISAFENGKTRIGLRWQWGNILGAVTWEHRFNPQIYATTQVSFTRYRYNLTQTLNATMTDTLGTMTLDEELHFRSHIMDLTAQTNFDYSPNPKHEIKFGAEYIYHRFRPQVASFQLLNTDISDYMVVDTAISESVVHAHEASLYFEDTWSPLSWLKMNMGLRTSIYGVNGKVYPSIEPRIGLRMLVIDDLAIKLSYSYMSQYIHLLSNSNISLPTDLWVPVSKQILPMRSVQGAAGITYNLLDQLELSVEGYYKYMKNLVEYKDGTSFLGSSAGWEEKVCMGDGWSYGVEFLAHRKSGKVTGWLAYTWSRTMRQFDREGEVLNFGKPFHAKYDREHDVSLTVQYQVTPKIELSGTFVFSTGDRATLATHVYYDSETGDRIEFFGERNNYQLPAYHRMDLGVTFHKPHKKWKNAEHLVNISIYNVYNNMNPFLLYPDYASGKLHKVTIFPILPSLSYTFKF